MINNTSMEVETVEESKSYVSNNKASTKVHRFYFVKIWPYEDPEVVFRIKCAEELVEKLDQEKAVLRQEIEKLKTRFGKYFHYSPRCRDNGIQYGLNSTSERLHQLQEQMKELNYKKHEYSCGRGGDKIYSSPSGEANIHGLQFCMLHGNNNLAKEKKMLREIDDAALTKGETLNPWSSKRAILQEIKVRNTEMEELEEAYSARIEKERMLRERQKSVDEKWTMLSQKIKEIDLKKDEAVLCILNLREKHWKANANFKEHVSRMNNVKELARKKDVAAVKELSHKQVDKLMHELNHNEVFRNSYERRVLPSLSFRSLSMDGRRMTNTG